MTNPTMTTYPIEQHEVIRGPQPTDIDKRALVSGVLGSGYIKPSSRPGQILRFLLHRNLDEQEPVSQRDLALGPLSDMLPPETSSRYAEAFQNALRNAGRQMVDLRDGLRRYFS